MKNHNIYSCVLLYVFIDDNLEKAFETYHHISNKDFIHATPTLFNVGTNREQLASCFLLAMKEDSVHGIYDTLKDCALISKYSGE